MTEGEGFVLNLYIDPRPKSVRGYDPIDLKGVALSMWLRLTWSVRRKQTLLSAYTVIVVMEASMDLGWLPQIWTSPHPKALRTGHCNFLRELENNDHKSQGILDHEKLVSTSAKVPCRTADCLPPRAFYGPVPDEAGYALSR